MDRESAPSPWARARKTLLVLGGVLAIATLGAIAVVAFIMWRLLYPPPPTVAQLASFAGLALPATTHLTDAEQAIGPDSYMTARMRLGPTEFRALQASLPVALTPVPSGHDAVPVSDAGNPGGLPGARQATWCFYNRAITVRVEDRADTGGGMVHVLALGGACSSGMVEIPAAGLVSP